VAADDLAVGVDGEGPAKLVQEHVVVPETVILEVGEAGGATVGPVHQNSRPAVATAIREHPENRRRHGPPAQAAMPRPRTHCIQPGTFMPGSAVPAPAGP
jgi:hypothetical protein